MKKNLAFLFLMTILLTACAGANPLADTTWELVSYGSIDSPTPALPARISFDAEERVSGSLGCNSFSGSYRVSGDKLEFDSLMTTLMGCEAQRMNQETAVMMLLSGTLSFEIDSDTLTIFSEDGNSALHLIRAEN